jgi:hypothetical protein
VERLVARANDIVVEGLDDGLVIYDGRDAQAHWLDPGATAVWNACRQPRTETEIATAAGVDRSRCEIALSQLIDLGLVEAESGRGYSRRAVLRGAAKVGLAGAVAVPIMSTFVPAAAAAGSGGTGSLSLYTPGYWKNHSLATTPLLPQTLGQYGGFTGFPVTTFAEAVLIFDNMNFGTGNGVNGLAGHLLAAELNVALNAAHGLTVPACATNAIAAANQFLASAGYTGVRSYPSSLDAQATALHIPLDKFNNGSLTC